MRSRGVRTFTLVLVACLLAGCASGGRSREATSSIVLVPESAPERFIELKDADAQDPRLARLVEEVRRARGASASFEMPSSESGPMFEELHRRWYEAHATYAVPVVVRHDGLFYAVATMV